MNIEDFDGYFLDEQLLILVGQGTYLITRRGRKGPVRLYYLEGFFVEVWFNSEFTDVIIVRGFSCSSLLEPYLKNIEVVDLIAPLNN